MRGLKFSSSWGPCARPILIACPLTRTRTHTHPGPRICSKPLCEITLAAYPRHTLAHASSPHQAQKQNHTRHVVADGHDAQGVGRGHVHHGEAQHQDADDASDHPHHDVAQRARVVRARIPSCFVRGGAVRALAVEVCIGSDIEYSGRYPHHILTLARTQGQMCEVGRGQALHASFHKRKQRVHRNHRRP